MQGTHISATIANRSQSQGALKSNTASSSNVGGGLPTTTTGKDDPVSWINNNGNNSIQINGTRGLNRLAIKEEKMLPDVDGGWRTFSASNISTLRPGTT